MTGPSCERRGLEKREPHVLKNETVGKIMILGIISPANRLLTQDADYTAPKDTRSPESKIRVEFDLRNPL